MAVEARHINLFHPQLIPSREIMNPITDANINLYNTTQMGNYSSVLPLSGTTTTTETLLPGAYNSLIADSVPQKTAMKSDSGLTYNHVPVQRKRFRETDSINYPFPSYRSCGSFSFLGEDISLQIQQQQLDVDRLISHHTEKVRMELEEKRKRQASRIIEAIEIGMMKRLKVKEDEIEKIGKLNWALEERVKSLCIENQIWRDLAQTNEATANALRTNLEQVLAETRGGAGIDDEDAATVLPAGVAAATALMDDAQSCCGSTDDNEGGVGENVEGWRTLARYAEVNGCAQDKNGEGTTNKAKINRSGNCSSRSRRLCRNCGKEESCVLILPCRHLCLCTVCGSTVHTCPICKSFKNASVHVNMS